MATRSIGHRTGVVLAFAGATLAWTAAAWTDEPAAEVEKAQPESAPAAIPMLPLMPALTAERKERAAEFFHAAGKMFVAAQERVNPWGQAPPEMMRQQFVAENTQQFRPLLATELRMIRSACQPTDDEWKSIRDAGLAGFQQAIAEYADAMLTWQQSGYQSDKRRELPNVRRRIMETLSDAVGKTLSADQAEVYQRNLQDRAAARQRAALLGLVAKADRQLLLSDEQQRKLTEELKTHWRDEWGQNLEYWQYGDYHSPTLPDELVIPILDPTQLDVWNTMQKRPFHNYGWMGYGFMQPLDFEADELDPEQAAEPAVGEAAADTQP